MTITLINGNCFDELKKIPQNSIDLILTDPPYGINYKSKARKDFGQIKGDEKLNIPLDEFFRILKPTGCTLVFYSPKNELIDKRKRNTLIWVKNDILINEKEKDFSNFRGQYECIGFFPKPKFEFKKNRPTNIFHCDRIKPENLIHPTEKPVQLLINLIRDCTQNNAVVLDPFMGSGTTGLACVKLKRQFIGIEIDESYFEIATKRLTNYTKH